MTRVSGPGSGLTMQLSDFVLGFDVGRVPTNVVDRAKELILDTVGVTLAASAGEMGEVVAGYARHVGGHPQATVIGKKAFKTSSPNAALVNGANAAMLDYDDTNFVNVAHSSGVLVPTVLALGEELGASGQQIIEAYILGYEALSRISTGIQPNQYLAGRHSTGTVGVMMSVAASSKLLGLDREQTATAFGIAASFSGALRGAFGSMTKAFHSGAAAMQGIMAARLARTGMTANMDTFERDNGYCVVTTGGRDRVDFGRIEAAVQDTDSYYLVTPGVGVKQYPTGTAVFAGLDSILEILAEQSMRPEEVASITFGANALTWDIHRYNGPGEPRSVEEARYSIKYPLAIAVVDGRCGLQQLTMERIMDPVARDLMDRITLYVHPELAELTDHVYSIPACEVTVKLKDGRQFSRFRRYARSYPKGEGISHETLVAKYRECAAPVLSSENVERSIALLGQLETVGEVSTLTKVLQ